MASNSSYRNVILIGGTGNLGAAALSALLEASTFNITVLSRETSNATFPDGIRVAKTDYTEESLLKALAGQDVVISAIGGMGFLQQKVVIEAAVKAGVKRFIPAEFSSNTLSNAVRELVPLFEQKKEVLDLLQEREAQGLSWTGLAIGGLFDWCLEQGFLPFDFKTHTATIWDSGDTRMSLTNLATFGRAMVSILQHPEATANKYLYIESVSTTQNELLASIEKYTRTKWTVQKVTTSEKLAQAQQLLSEGNMAGILINVQASLWSTVPGLRGNFAEDETLANALLGIRKEDVESTVERVVKNGHFTGAFAV